MGDPELAAFMRKHKMPAPVERIMRTDWIATAVNRKKLGGNMGKRIVELACGHRAVTTNIKRCKCEDCHKMIMDGEDYEAFRNR
jgi:hypothetical protein